jgi:two-component system, chemotaxis family, protein-glutamate methylesterase/glutaminase
VNQSLPGGEVPDDRAVDRDPLEIDGPLTGGDPLGQPSKITCPDCGGVLWGDGHDESQLRCRVGHAYSIETLHAEHGRAIENALWAAVRALEESAILARRISERAETSGKERAAAAFSSQARTAERHASAIREILYRAEPVDRDRSGAA